MCRCLQNMKKPLVMQKLSVCVRWGRVGGGRGHGSVGQFNLCVSFFVGYHPTGPGEDRCRRSFSRRKPTGR